MVVKYGFGREKVEYEASKNLVRGVGKGNNGLARKMNGYRTDSSPRLRAVDHELCT